MIRSSNAWKCIALFWLINWMPAQSDPAKTRPPTYSQWAILLREFTCPQGVQYAQLKSLAGWKKVAHDFTLSESAFAQWDTTDQIAYLINLYNYATVALILDHYPVQSIRDIPNPWQQKVVPLFGKLTTLDAIENEWLRSKYREPRIHMALNCASRSCPILQSTPFLGQTLESQLEKALNAFLKDGQKNQVTPSGFKVSKIFEWYGQDFQFKYGDWKNLVSERMEKGVVSKKGNPSFDFLEYDWKLNDVATCKDNRALTP